MDVQNLYLKCTQMIWGFGGFSSPSFSSTMLYLIYFLLVGKLILQACFIPGKKKIFSMFLTKYPFTKTKSMYVFQQLLHILVFIAEKILVGVFEFLSPACLLNFHSAFPGLNYLSLSEIGAINQSFFLQNVVPWPLFVPTTTKMNVWFAFKILSFVR